MKGGTGLALWALALLLAGCVISPRRIVDNGNNPNVTPSPTPGLTPTPVPTITPTPTPTPTPFAGMSFVFTMAPGSTMISGVRVNPDGTRSALPGSPFAAPEPAKQLLTVGRNLLLQGQNGLALFSVDRESGQLRQIDQIALPGISSAVVRPSDQTVFLLNGDGVSLYRVMDNRLVLLPGAPLPLPPDAAERSLKPALLILDSSGNPYISFTAPGGGTATVFAEVSVGADGTMRQLSLTESLPEEVANAFAVQSSAARPRLAAVITP